jgi:hypothetical protein
MTHTKMIVASLAFFFTVNVFAANPTTCPADTQPKGKTLETTIAVSKYRPLKPSSKPEVNTLLKKFETPAQSFSCRMKQIGETEQAIIWRLTFPSPCVSPDPLNNTVWCEYYRAKVAGPRPAVILLHPLDLRINLMRTICEKMTQAGMDCLWLEMAYYDKRSSNGMSDLFTMIKDPERLKSAVCQTVMDVRRATEFLISQPNVMPKNIYLMGCSLGALVTSVVMGVDGEYPKVVLLLGGADIAKIMTTNDFSKSLLAMSHQGHIPSEAELRPELQLIEPLTYIDRAKDVQLLMVNNSGDTVILPECSRKLAQRVPHTKMKWYSGDHTNLPMEELVPLITDFYKGTLRD